MENTLKQIEEGFDEFGAVFSFPHTAVNAKAEIPQRDGLPMLYNGMYITHDIKSFLKSSIIKVLQQLVEREENKEKEMVNDMSYEEATGLHYAKQDTISYLKSELANLSTNIDKE